MTARPRCTRSRCAASSSTTRASRRSTASTSSSASTRCSAWPARTAPASPPCSRRSSAWSGPTPARSGCAARRSGCASVVDAADHGIGMVFQEQSLVPNLTAAENIVLGSEGPRRAPRRLPLGHHAQAGPGAARQDRLRHRPARPHRHAHLRRPADGRDRQGAAHRGAHPAPAGDHPRRADLGAGVEGDRDPLHPGPPAARVRLGRLRLAPSRRGARRLRPGQRAARRPVGRRGRHRGRRPGRPAPHDDRVDRVRRPLPRQRRRASVRGAARPRLSVRGLSGPTFRDVDLDVARRRDRRRSSASTAPGARTSAGRCSAPSRRRPARSPSTARSSTCPAPAPRAPPASATCRPSARSRAWSGRCRSPTT